MSNPSVNIHATAIVVGTRGIAFVGPSGAGKSLMALDFLAGAREAGLFAVLIGDDRIDISARAGVLVARGPESIRGLIEVRGSGIHRVATIEAAILHLAIQPVQQASSPRLPSEGERFELADGLSLPLLRLPRAEGLRPWSLYRSILSQPVDI